MMTLDQKTGVPNSLDLYTVAEIAVILSVSRKSVFTWISQGLLPAIRLGPGQRLLRIRRNDLEDFIAQQHFSSPSASPK